MGPSAYLQRGLGVSGTEAVSARRSRGGGSRFAAVEVVAEGGHDAVDNSENAADDELHHAADADKGEVEGWRRIGEIISRERSIGEIIRRKRRRQAWGNEEYLHQ